jgi:predicted P-loop ATPase
MSKAGTEKATTKNERIEAYLHEKYLFRYNTIKCQPEIKDNSKEMSFLPIDKYLLNSLKRELDANYGEQTSAENIRSILESTYSPKVNPIHEYFKELKEFNPRSDPDYIKELSETVTLNNQDRFYSYLKKWLVSVVANAKISVGCQNHTCLVLTGSQGKFKTTWMDLLCPKPLRHYLFTGKLNIQSKDTLALIAEMFLINIDDQLRQINKIDENELKNLITTPSVKYRRPYDVYITEYPHTASFMASVNGNDFLTDPTGSRRFLPFEVLGIDIDAAKQINIDWVYSQAYHLFKNNFTYWFNESEIEDLHNYNQAFQVISIEEQLLNEYFEVPEHRGAATDYLQIAVILKDLENQTKQRLSPKKLGEALSRRGFEKWQRTVNGVTKWVYSVIKKESTDVDLDNKLGTTIEVEINSEKLPF